MGAISSEPWAMSRKKFVYKTWGSPFFSIHIMLTLKVLYVITEQNIRPFVVQVGYTQDAILETLYHIHTLKTQI